MKPAPDPMTASELVALFAVKNRHPNALGFELRRAAFSTICEVIYGEFADPTPFLEDVPAVLGNLAYDEMERRQGALSRLMPALCAASKS